jgi:copper transport protein
VGTLVRTSAADPGVPDEEVGRFRRMLVLESGLAAAVLGLTATLVSVQPARTAHEAAQAAAHVGALGTATPVAAATEVALGLGLRKDGTTAAPDDSTASGWVNAVVSPAANGLPNEVHVSVVDTDDKPIMLQGIGIDLRKRGSDEASQQYPLLPSGPGHYFASFVLPAAGSWDLGLLVVAEDGRADLVLLPVEATLPEN